MRGMENAVNAREIYKHLVRTAPYQPATNYWRAVELDAVLRYGMPEGRGLDLGCGDGKLTQVLTEGLPIGIRRSWVGVDPDPEETGLASQINVYEAVHTCGGDSIPEEDASFDYAFSNSVLEHIPDIDSVIAEVARVVRRGGHFVFTVPSDTFHSCLNGPLLGAPSERYFRQIDTRCAHERYWGVAEWTTCLGRHSFDLVAHAEYLDLRQTHRWETLSNLTGGLLYKLHGNRMRPIEIQRKLKMRRAGRGLIDWIAAQISQAALLGADPRRHSGSCGTPQACLLIDATRR